VEVEAALESLEFAAPFRTVLMNRNTLLPAANTSLGLALGVAQTGFAHTKVVATLGPASEHRVGELIDAGMSVARINFSHGSPEDHRRRIEAARAAAAERRVPLGILADIQGPKLRMGTLEEHWRTLEAGERVTIRQGPGPAARGELCFDFEGFLDSILPGHRLFLADGAVELETESVRKTEISARVVRGGVVGDRKGVNLPDSALAVELPTPKDKVDLELARALGVDVIGLSFVADAADVRAVRLLAPGLPIVSKIERLAALSNIVAILAESDGIMVARGDLGVEVELEHLPIVQKSLLQAALRAGKFAITATEMLESMIESSRPTRAEVADIANAVLDGTDALMLSAETAVGKHPVEAVETMCRIARAVEHSQRYHELPRVAFRSAEPTFSNAIALAAADAAEALKLSKIVCFTETGNSVRLISRYRPSAEIFALSPHERTLNNMTLLAHVRPLYFPRQTSLEEMLAKACEALLERRWVVPGEEIVFVAGVPPGVSRSTNVVKLHRVGERTDLH
jgi:pyruvate kinase